MPEGGSGDGGDVYLGKSDDTNMPVTVLAWKRLVPKAGATRRHADGEPSVFVFDQATAWTALDLLHKAGLGPVIVECKATERLNVTRTLAKAKAKVDRWWKRNHLAGGV
jgi:hypothetical protein